MKFVLAMIARNLAVERRSPRTGFLRMVFQPAVYIFVFGHVVGRMLPAGSAGDYAAVMAPGVVAITLMSAPYLVVGSAILSGFYFRTMEAWLLSPVALRSLVLALVACGTLYGSVSALVVALLVWAILGIVPGQPLLMAYFAVAGSLFFSLLSVTVLLVPATPKQGQEVFSFLMMPMTFFGCTFYSFSMLQPPFDYLALLLPTTYLSEGLRAAYLPGGGDGLPGNWIAVGLAATTVALAPVADRVLARRLRDFTW
jgi:ABC-2 type transport system permease protein